jgi:hypothetical protein
MPSLCANLLVLVVCIVFLKMEFSTVKFPRLSSSASFPIPP